MTLTRLTATPMAGKAAKARRLALLNLSTSRALHTLPQLLRASPAPPQLAYRPHITPSAHSSRPPTRPRLAPPPDSAAVGAARRCGRRRGPCGRGHGLDEQPVVPVGAPPGRGGEGPVREGAPGAGGAGEAHGTSGRQAHPPPSLHSLLSLAPSRSTSLAALSAAAVLAVMGLAEPPRRSCALRAASSSATHTHSHPVAASLTPPLRVPGSHAAGARAESVLQGRRHRGAP